jgi:hypothetical protein
MSDNNEKDLLKELESIVNDADSRLREEWRVHTSELLKSMCNHAYNKTELANQDQGAIVAVISAAPEGTEADPDRIVGPRDREDGKLGAVSILLTLDKPEHVDEFFDDNTIMVLTQKQYEHLGYFVAVKHRSGKRRGYFVTPNFLAVMLDDKVSSWGYSEREYHEAENTLPKSVFTTLGKIVIGLNAPLEMKQTMPDVFDALVSHLLDKIEQGMDGDDDE